MKESIRILQVGLSSNPGGVENLIYSYYKYIDKTKFKFDFLDMYGDGIAYADELKKNGGQIFSIRNYKKHPLNACIELNNLLNKEKYDVVHVHMQSAANLIPIIIPYLHKNIVVIAHSHSSSTPKGFARKLLNSININLLRRMKIEKWACGVNAGKWMWGNKFDVNNIIPNAIEEKKYRYNGKIREKIRMQCGFSEDDKVIGFVGRFGDEKNTFFLLDILKLLLEKSDKYKLLTVGGNGLYNEFVKKMQDMDLKKNFFSAGIQKNTSEWYQAMDAFLLPSFFEGFPVVAVEAQASGLYCLLSNRISKEVKLSNNTIFLPIENIKQWVEHIENMNLHDYNRRKDCIINRNYNIESAIKIVETKYELLVKK